MAIPVWINGKPHKAKMVERLGWNAESRCYPRVVEIDGREVVVVRDSRGRWVKHVPRIVPRGPYVGQDQKGGE